MRKLLFMLLCSGFTYAQLNIQTPGNLITCADNFDGISLFDLSAITTPILSGLNPNDYTVQYYLTLQSAEENNNPIQGITSYANSTPYFQTIYVRVTQISVPINYAVTSFNLIVNPKPAYSSISTVAIFDGDGTNDGMATIDLISISDSVLQNHPATESVSFYMTESYTDIITSPFTTNTTTIYYIIDDIINGCVTTGPLDIIILPEDYVTEQPTGASTQTFTEGETLADLEIGGENILWYDNPGETAGLPFKPKNNDTPLPLSTVLVNNSTYYASQTLNTIESTNRLAVTVSTTMGTDKNTFSTLKYYPNPVNDVLTITNSSDIEALSVTNILGQTIISKQINSTNTQLDLSSLNNGVYFVKIVSEGKSRTLKIIKE